MQFNLFGDDIVSVIEQKSTRVRSASRERMPIAIKTPSPDRGGKDKESIAGSAPAAMISGAAVAVCSGLLMLAIACPILMTTVDPAKSAGVVAMSALSLGAFCGGVVMARILGRRNIWLSLAAALILNAAVFVLSFALPGLGADISILGWLKRGLAVLIFILGAYIAAPGGSKSRHALGGRSRKYKKR